MSKTKLQALAADGDEADLMLDAPRKANGRFAKGHSGNLKGRPKGARGILALYKEQRDVRVPIKKDGKTKLMTRPEAFVENTLNRAVAGDPKAAANLLMLERALGGLDPEVNDEVTDPADVEAFKQLQRKLRAGGTGSDG